MIRISALVSASVLYICIYGIKAGQSYLLRPQGCKVETMDCFNSICFSLLKLWI